MINYYEVLGISENASTDQISEVGKMLLRTNHPYVTGKRNLEQRFGEVYEAVAVLIDETLRCEYNYILTNALMRGDVSSPSLDAGAVAARVRSAQKEAEMLEKDYVLFFRKFLMGTATRDEIELEVSAYQSTSIPTKLGLALLMSGICLLVVPKVEGYSSKPVFMYILGALSLIGGILLLKRALK
jgi:DnaJ-class molecular chaperone